MSEISFNTILQIITRTPIWVWAILVYLLYVGIRALKPRIVTIEKLIFLPLALIALKFRVFLSPDAWIYVVGLSAGLFAGFLKVRNSPVKILKDIKSIQIPGSFSLIVILLGIFVMRYFFGYLQATDPVAYLIYIDWELALSGILSGYFTGQRTNYLYRYYTS